jgi:hypothetical protein
MSFVRLILALALLAAPAATFAQTTAAMRLSGRILLQVESKGEAWYVNPVDGRRYSLGRPADAQRIMSELGLGVSNADLAKIPAANAVGSRGDTALRSRLAGRILLQVESRGEAWYVDPLSRERHPLGRPADAFRLLQTQGLGISNAELAKIPVGRTDLATVRYDVPFTPQAPFAEWFDARQQEGCEEASVVMAVKWATGDPLTLMEARTRILAMADWQQKEFGYYHDTSVQDTADRLFRSYFRFTDYEVVRDIDAYDIIEALEGGDIVVTAINGRTVGNPFFAPPGPLRHMVVVTGYDADTDEFLVHDPGTKNGADFRYTHAAMAASLRDYPSGRYAPIPPGTGTAMIVVHRK